METFSKASESISSQVREGGLHSSDIVRSQQPMSLVTIHANALKKTPHPHHADDLLTLRILEASERKMQLIKKLLSPEEYDSVAANLLASDRNETWHFPQDQDSLNEPSKQHNGSQVSLVPMEMSEELDRQRGKFATDKLSKSETNLKLASATNLRDNLAQKREAIEFFFQASEDELDINQESARGSGGGAELSMELRSGYYLDFTKAAVQNEQLEQRVIKSPSFSLMDRFTGLLGYFGLSLESGKPDDSSDKDLFLDYHQRLDRLPYTRARNILSMKRRLEADGQLDKIRLPPPDELDGRLNGKTAHKNVEARTTEDFLNQLDSHWHHERANGRLFVEGNRHKGHLLSIDSGQQAKFMNVIQSVGHLSAVQLIKSQKFTHLVCPVNLLRYHPAVESFLRAASPASRERQNLANLSKFVKHSALTTCWASSLKIKLTPVLLSFTRHKLMLNEEFVALNMVEMYDQVRVLNKKFTYLYTRLLNCVEDKSTDVLSALELWLGTGEQLKSAEQKLLASMSELEASRREQGFNSTRLVVECEPAAESLAAAQQAIQPALIALKAQADIHQVEEYERRLDGLQGCCGSVRYNLNLNAIKPTPDNECPQDEIKRRNAILRWMGSLQLRLLIGDHYYYDFELDTVSSSSKLENLFEVDLRKSQIAVFNALNNDAPELDLKFEMRKRTTLIKMMRLPMRSKLIATGNFKIRLSKIEQRHSIKLNFLSINDDEMSAHIELLSSCPNTSRLEDEVKLKRKHLIHSLYKQTFNSSHAYDDTETKLYKLINKTDLAYLLRARKNVDRRSQFVILDPFEATFEPDDSNSDGLEPVRQALLVWRWMNNLNQVVYLSERENMKGHGLHSLKPLEDIGKPKRLGQSAQKSEHQVDSVAGYKLIEKIRLAAVEYIRRYELQLEATLKLREAELSAAAGGGGGAHLRAGRMASDLLIEPHIKVDLSGFVRSARQLLPRRTARRPLMPRRRPGKSLAGMVAAAAALAEHHHQAQSGGGSDLESRMFGQWQRLAAQRAASLQLVVTIQQATNVPMRVVRLSPLLARSSSPFFGGQQAASPSSFMSGVQSSTLLPPGAPASQLSSSYLVPPTTYVEIVFQRRQQASSLAQGKDPAWNETLFFPVAVPTGLQRSMMTAEGEMSEEDSDLKHTMSQSTGTTSQSQLADEFLQLNLYDYYFYQHDNVASGDISRQASEAQTMSAFDDRGESSSSIFTTAAAAEASSSGGSIRGSKMLATRQRIERHLLGSLRVPLTTLLSSGRIEGSFVLSQPLFLENYQFEPASMGQRNLSPLASSSVRFDGTSQGGTSPEHHSLGRNMETLISLFITLDPPISIPFHLYLATGTHESEPVFEYARLWERILSRHKYSSLNNAAAAASQANLGNRTTGDMRLGKRIGSSNGHRARHVRALVLQREVKYCLVTRLLAPLEPPKLLLEQVGRRSNKAPTCSSNPGTIDQQMRALSRFVSLLSPLKYGLFNARLLASSLWFDSEQLLNKSLGGPEERAVLLCNYFLYLGHCAGLLLGDAIPEGHCTYVIVWREPTRSPLDAQLHLQPSNLMESATSGNQISNLRSAPVEQSSFVARLPILINAKSIQLWDPNTGKSYTLSEHLQLVSVGSIVTMENVYANMQSINVPADTNYDIRLKKFWFPLFEGGGSQLAGGLDSPGNRARSLEARLTPPGVARRSEATNWRRQLARLDAMRRSIGRPPMDPLVSMANSNIDYACLTESQCEELKQAIERLLKAHLLKWRPDRPTYFNRTLSRCLAEKLSLFEGYLVDNGEPVGDQWKCELANMIRDEVLAAHLATSNAHITRQIVSWPVNLPYTSMKSILDSLFASGVHDADLMLDAGQSSKTMNTQFLVACHVHPYPARVVSAWIYVAALVTNTKATY